MNLSREAADARVLAVLGPEALAERLRTRKVLEGLSRPPRPRYEFTAAQMEIAVRSLGRVA